MGSKLLGLLGIDEYDPEVVSGRAAATQLAGVVEYLIRARKDRNITQQQVADRMETTQSVISDFERIGGDPRLSMLMHYAHAIGGRLHTSLFIDETASHPVVSRTGEYSETTDPPFEQQRFVTDSSFLQLVR